MEENESFQHSKIIKNVNRRGNIWLLIPGNLYQIFIMQIQQLFHLPTLNQIPTYGRTFFLFPHARFIFSYMPLVIMVARLIMTSFNILAIIFIPPFCATLLTQNALPLSWLKFGYTTIVRIFICIIKNFELKYKMQKKDNNILQKSNHSKPSKSQIYCSL